MENYQKPFWKSKTIWAAFITGVLGIADAFGLPVPKELYIILASFGLYGLRKAKTEV